MLSQGPFNYNRFDALQEKAKPDFLDMDKDGNKKESMKKAIKDKDGKCDDCGKKDCNCDDKKDKKDGKGKPPWLKEADMSKAPTIKNYKPASKTDVKYDKDMKVMAPNIKKEDVDLVELDYDEVSTFLWEKGICKNEKEVEYWLEHATQSTLSLLANQLQEDKAPQYMRTQSIDEGSCGSKGYQKGGMVKPAPKAPKATVVKEDVIEYMMETNMVNNPVSAEALFNHISDEFLEEIEERIMEAWKPMNTAKVANQRDKAYDKEQAAARAGNEKEVNKQMQRRIAMTNPAGRKAGLENAKKGY